MMIFEQKKWKMQNNKNTNNEHSLAPSSSQKSGAVRRRCAVFGCNAMQCNSAGSLAVISLPSFLSFPFA
jgi:hypothetical protein